MVKVLIACCVISFIFIFLGELFCNISIGIESQLRRSLLDAISIFCLIIGILLVGVVLTLILYIGAGR